MHNGETLSIIFLSVFFGIALLIEAKQSKELINLIEQLNRIIMRMINLIMALAPYAVFCLVSKAIAELGIDLVKEISGYFFVIMIALLFHAFVTQMVILKSVSYTHLTLPTIYSV